MSYEIVGIVSDVRFWMWDEPASKIFMPFVADATTHYTPWQVQEALHQNVAVRVTRSDAVTLDAIRRAVAEVTDGLPIERVRTMTTAMVDASGNTPGIMLLLTSAAIVALVLAAIGIFGVVSYTVSRRAHEIGIRVALGASRRTIMRLVLSGSAWLALAGVALGSLVSFWLTPFVAGELFPGFSPAAPRVFGAVAGVLVAIVLVATWLPARRAADVDPAVALRAE